MSNKRDVILATAKQLFIEHGVAGTTIANIANQAGIAKGSVYSYFKSKQDIVQALLTQSLEVSSEQLEKIIAREDLHEMALLQEHVKQELGQVNDERALLKAITYDESMVMNDESIEYLQDFRASYYQNQLKLISTAYKNLEEKWYMDVIALLNGALQEYSIYIAFDNAQLTLERCAQTISVSIDAVVQRLNHSDIQPALSPSDLPLYHEDPQVRRLSQAKELVEELKALSHELADDDKKVVNETLNLLETQLELETISQVLLRALVANLAPYNLLNAKRAKLAELLDVELI